jgi:hypothetical protein
MGWKPGWRRRRIYMVDKVVM